MALPTIIEDKERAWLFKVITQSNEPELNACIAGLFLGTGMTTLEICRIQIKDIMKKNGELSRSFEVRGEIIRPFHLSKPKLKSLVTSYLAKRVKDGDNPDAFRGFDPDEPLLKRASGRRFEIKRRTTEKGTTSYNCNGLNNHIKRLLSDAGIDQPSILSGRRTMAVKLKRKGVDVPTIHLMLGNRSLETTLRLIETDTADMLAIAEMAF